jgi:hypothetical protein
VKLDRPFQPSPKIHEFQKGIQIFRHHAVMARRIVVVSPVSLETLNETRPLKQSQDSIALMRRNMTETVDQVTKNSEEKHAHRHQGKLEINHQWKTGQKHQQRFLDIAKKAFLKYSTRIQMVLAVKAKQVIRQFIGVLQPMDTPREEISQQV